MAGDTILLASPSARRSRSTVPSIHHERGRRPRSRGLQPPRAMTRRWIFHGAFEGDPDSPPLAHEERMASRSGADVARARQRRQELEVVGSCALTCWGTSVRNSSAGRFNEGRRIELRHISHRLVSNCCCVSGFSRARTMKRSGAGPMYENGQHVMSVKV